MIAYDKTLLENTQLIEEAQSLKASGFISATHYAAIVKELPELKVHRNWLLRALFFILGSFLYSSCSGVIALFGMNALNNSFTIFIYIYALIGIAGIELMSRNTHYYNYGLDNVFLLGGEILLCSAIYASTENTLLTLFCLFIITALSYCRYLHLLSLLLACIGLTGSIAFLSFEFGALGKSLLPFIMIVTAAVLYTVSILAPSKMNLGVYYKAVAVLKGFSLLLFYLSGNYLVVRELSVVLLNNEIPIGTEIPLAPFFYAFTLAVPAFYIVYGLRQKSRLLLWIGLLALAFSVFTIRYYHHFLPPAIALTLGGVLLFAVAYFSIRKLKDNTTGITFQPDRSANSNLMLAETLVTVAQFGQKAAVESDSNSGFGGGGFSGGGSEGGY